MKKSTVYVYRIKSDLVSDLVTLASNKVAYVGKTVQKFSFRDHARKSTSRCTLRRTLTCVLKDTLSLNPVTPRSPTAQRVFDLNTDDEKKLSRWISDNLEISKIAVSTDIDDVEKALIKYHEPPFNIEGWKNPIGNTLKEMRKEFYLKTVP